MDHYHEVVRYLLGDGEDNITSATTEGGSDYHEEYKVQPYFKYVDTIVGISALLVTLYAIFFLTSLILLVCGYHDKCETTTARAIMGQAGATAPTTGAPIRSNQRRSSVISGSTFFGGSMFFNKATTSRDDDDNNVAGRSRGSIGDNSALFNNNNIPTTATMRTKIYRTNNSSSNPHSFNIYLIFLLLPDVLVTFSTSVGMFWRAGNDEIYHGIFGNTLCQTQWFSGFTYYVTNTYLNAVMTYQVYRLVRNSYNRCHTKPPPYGAVARHICLAYGFGILVGIWANVNQPWSPVQLDWELCKGVLGFPPPPEETADDGDKLQASSIFYTNWFAAIVVILLMLPGWIFVIVLGSYIWWKQLLPIRGRTRAVALYFFRIVVVFVSCYIPNCSVAMAMMIVDDTPGLYSDRLWWLYLVYHVLTVIQCFITLLLASSKEDIHYALHITYSQLMQVPSSLWCYYCHNGDRDDVNDCGINDDGVLENQQQPRMDKSSSEPAVSIWEECDVYQEGITR